MHSIRFLGNDAAHDIKTPNGDSLDAALIIVEHLLTTVYILDEEARGKLEELLVDYADIEKLIVKKLEDFEDGNEYPLQKYLGKDVRLFSGSIKKVEKKLNEKIGQKKFNLLRFGKKAKYLNSEEELQHYVVVTEPKDTD